MRLAVYVKRERLKSDPRLTELKEILKPRGFEFYDIETHDDLLPETDMLLSVGGDGTFLSASKRVGDTGIPVLGVNLGRLGFLSEYRPDDVAKALIHGDYTIEDRTLLDAEIYRGKEKLFTEVYPFALNEITVHRLGSAMLGVDVRLNGETVPTYWADGLLVATSSGSTAYSLSVGGPICTPDSKVLIISPIAPHNLNARPLIIPDTSVIGIGMQSRDNEVMITMDNRSIVSAPDVTVRISMAQFSLKRIRLNKSNFIKALTSKLFWGEDVRNGNEQ
ncbi:MAG: NAD(+)/NADH kinase [Bacteroidales bacterium]